MKNLIFSIIIAALLMQILAMKQSNDQPAPIYNKITNKELISVIEEFVEKGKGTKTDSCSKFLKLYIKKCPDGTFQLDLHHMPDAMHNSYVKSPMIICAPIAGKKIYVESEESFFIGPNRPEVGVYFKDDCPEIYKEFLEKAKYDKCRNEYQSADSWLYDGSAVSMDFDKNGKLLKVYFQEFEGL